MDELAELCECVVPNANSLSSASTGQCPYPWALVRSDVLIWVSLVSTTFFAVRHLGKKQVRVSLEARFGFATVSLILGNSQD